MADSQNVRRRRIQLLPIAGSVAVAVMLAAAANSVIASDLPANGPSFAPGRPVPPAQCIRPAADDGSAASLKAYQQALLAANGGRDREVPWDVKADHFEWLIDRYLWAPRGLVHHTVTLPDEPDGERDFHFGDDVATWNGALLAAFSYKYAVAKDRDTLDRIARLLEGFHFYIEATGQPGLMARCVLQRDTPLHDATLRYNAPDGSTYYVRSDAAKGTYNQVVGGYAVMMLLAYDDLPPQSQRLARRDLQALVSHLVEHDYRLTERDGTPTAYGNLTPLIASQSVPFNAQVAYLIIAAGHHFPGPDLVKAKLIRREFERLRNKHHVYYENPATHWLRPQRVGDSPLVKGMNDRNHLVNAAYVGLLLEREYASRSGEEIDREFVFQLGRTLIWTMRHIADEHNGLCNAMWAGLTADPVLRSAMLPDPREAAAWDRIRVQLLADAHEQLRRFPLDRFSRPGLKIDTAEPQWVDGRKRHDAYVWKSGPYYRFEETGPPTNHLCASIDFLHAYWLMRSFRL